MSVSANAAPVVRSGAGWRSGVITEPIIGDFRKVASEEQEGYMGLFPGQKAIGTDPGMMAILASDNYAVRGCLCMGYRNPDELLYGYLYSVDSFPFIRSNTNETCCQ
jgi:hypothetical protein